MGQYLAFDLGASSGRAILGTLADGRIELQEVHRFGNGGVEVHGGLFWNILGLYGELKTGLRKAGEMGVALSGIAVDTWGVDFALIDGQGNFLGFPRMYRDPRNEDIMDYAFAKVPKETIYARTGIQFMNFNSLFQLSAMERAGEPALQVASRMLMIPNALTYLLSGNASAEYTIATTGQFYDPETSDWAWDLIDGLGIPRRIFPRIAAPCTVVGDLRQELCDELRCAAAPVILVGSHDTASAVAAVPARNDRSWAYLSSGTWSLLGVELEQPLISEETLAANYTNEGGICGTIRFLKNIMGLWLVQESREEFLRRGEEYSFAELEALAKASEPFRSLVDVNDESFVLPGDMPSRLADYCRRTGQPEPETPGQVVRCAVESLALRYRQTVEELEQLTDRPIEVLHLVGGGSKDALLNQMTANAIGRTVVTGPVEATALGNLVAQAIAVGELKDLEEARQVIANSIDTGEFTPDGTPGWDEAYRRYREMTAAL